jgi:hypothetical protein
VAACTGFLLFLLWGGTALHLTFDKAQTTYQASLNVANLSQVVEEHLTHRIYEIDQALLGAKREYERQPAGFTAEDLSAQKLAPESSAARVEVIDADGYALTAGGPGGMTRAYLGDSEAFTAHLRSPTGRLLIGKPVLTTATVRRAGVFPSPAGSIARTARLPGLSSPPSTPRFFPRPSTRSTSVGAVSSP